MSGIVTKLASHYVISGIDGDGGAIAVLSRTMVAAVVGGTTTAISGGKFANGAQTAAFAHLFNQESSALEKCLQEGCSFWGGLKARFALMGDGISSFWNDPTPQTEDLRDGLMVTKDLALIRFRRAQKIDDAKTGYDLFVAMTEGDWHEAGEIVITETAGKGVANFVKRSRPFEFEVEGLGTLDRKHLEDLSGLGAKTVAEEWWEKDCHACQ